MAKLKREKFYMDPKQFAAWRKAKGLTQRQAGELIGVETLRISKWECGVAPVPKFAVIIYTLHDRLAMHQPIPKE